ncbi:MAG: bifunctional hydroxymethylpyrimidine kinase/phosphomethylpyrimidine kinase, partial [Candidatus Methanomethylophilaceae archaeon]|nr:bifunctional hydroxymethylpyrimidine kinase/phosphomethylpyrimidine kinase [Candidatus Methanomethylophilaceae archaeon]
VKTLKRDVIPMCELVTPNRHEAEVLSGMRIENKDDLMFACEVIGKTGSSVYIKGGHFNTPTVVDYLYLSSEFTKFEYPRLKKSGHGSGCVLSSFITASLAKGIDIMNAVVKSRELIQDSIATQYQIGKGDLVVNPMVKLKGESDRSAVLGALDSATSRILDIVPDELVPKSGMNIAMAMKDAAGPEEIAAVDKRMSVHNGIIRRNGQIKFGAAENLSYILLTVMKHDPSMRCIMSIAYSPDTMYVMQDIGLNVVVAEMSRDRPSESTEAALSKSKRIPDAIVDKGGRKERIIRLLAKDTKDMLGKLEQLL